MAISMTYGFGIYVACSEIEGLFERPIFRELEIHIEGYAVHQEFGQNLLLWQVAPVVRK